MPNRDRKVHAVHERLETLGPHALSDVELLTAILGPASGANPGAKAATALLEAAPMAELAWASPEQLSTIPGIGRARAAALAAAFEAGRRAGWAPPRRGDLILDPRSVYELLRRLGHAEREEFWVVVLDVRGRLIKATCVSQGSLTECPVNPRDVLREAVRVGAHGVIFAHNHPSGAADPSPADVELTHRLRAAAELVGLVPRDHVIVAHSAYFSFVESGRWAPSARAVR